MSRTRRPGALVAAALLLLSLLAGGGCGRKAKPEPLFGGGTEAVQIQTR